MVGGVHPAETGYRTTTTTTTTSTSASDTDDDDDVNALCHRLTGLGFHREDAMAASKATKSTDPTWTAYRGFQHVPETRLPAACRAAVGQRRRRGSTSAVPRSAGDVAAASSRVRPHSTTIRARGRRRAWLWDRGYPGRRARAASDHGGNRRSPRRPFQTLVLAGESTEISGLPRVVVEARRRRGLARGTHRDRAIVGEDRVEPPRAGRGVAVDVQTNEGSRDAGGVQVGRMRARLGPLTVASRGGRRGSVPPATSNRRASPWRTSVHRACTPC